MKIWMKGALALGAFGSILAGCNGSDDDGGPSAGATATSTVTTSGTANATASGTPGPAATPSVSLTGTASGTPTPTPGTGPNVLAVALVGAFPFSNGRGASFLVVLNASRPAQVLRRLQVTGAGQSGATSLVGIDYRPANRQLYALELNSGLFTLDTSTGAATSVGGAFREPLLSGSSAYGFDFNPVADRIRVVSDSAFNFRLDPATGAPVDASPSLAGLQRDPNLAYDVSDRSAGRVPRVVAAAYSNSVRGAASTTNYAIDAATGSLVTQGTRAGVTPAVSPNTGRLFTVGTLGVSTGSAFRVHLDIGRGDVALAAIDNVLHSISLSTGAATRIGPIGGVGNGSVLGLAIVP